MNSVLDKYFTSKKNEMLEYINLIINIFSYKLDINVENKLQVIKRILNVYFTKYYMISNINYDGIYKHFNCDKETDSNLKTIILSVVKYYESEKISINEHEDEIIYFSSMIYFAYLIERLRETIILVPNKVEFIKSIANKVSTEFECKEDYKFQKNFYKLIDLVKANTKKEKKLIKTLENITYNKEFYNEYTNIKEQFGIYKISNKYYVKELEDYKDTDTKKVLKKSNSINTLSLMSYQLSLIVLLKCIFKDQRIYMVLPVDRDFYKKKMNTNRLLKLVSSSYVASYSMLLIKADEYVDCDNLNEIKNNGIKLIIEIDNYEEYKKIKFDDKMIALIDKDFIFKYKQELDENSINYIEKEEERKYKEKELFKTKTDIVEVIYE